MIPKKIHYVWMGKNPKNSKIKRCMKTWNKKLTGYEIIEWNEDNFDINAHPFVKKAYEEKKWAFVSDYVRFYAVYKYGGVYFDTDVIMIDRIDDLLSNKMFVGFESKNYPFTAVFGAEKGHTFCKRVLDYYDNIDLDEFDFAFENNNTLSISDILINEYGCIPNDTDQLLTDGIRVYNSNTLCNPSLKSKTIHAFTATWIDKSQIEIRLKITKALRARCTNKVRIVTYLIMMRLFHIFGRKSKAK